MAIGPVCRCTTFVCKTSLRSRVTSLALTILAGALTPRAALADEGGVSFWLPGTFGSLAAVPGQPGWSFATFGYNTNVNAGTGVSAAREITIGALNPTLRANLSATLHGDADFVFVTPSYGFCNAGLWWTGIGPLGRLVRPLNG